MPAVSFEPQSVTPLGWLFVLAITVALPAAVFRNREAALAMASIPLRYRFVAMLIPQIGLGLFAGITASVEGVSLFPMTPPAARDWGAGLLFLVTTVAIVRPFWRRSILEGRLAWRLFAPTDPQERRMWVALSLSAGIAEEMVWRGVLPALLTRAFGDARLAIALATVSFGVAHAIQGARSVLAIAAIALAFHGLVLLSGSLYVAMAAHFVYDVIAGFTYERMARELGHL